MKKFIGTVLFLAIAYSSLWFYEGNKGKSFIEQKMKEAQIQSDKVTLSGYPLQYTVSIENPTYVDTTMNITSKGTISLTSNLLGNKFWISRNGEINIKPNDGPSSLSLKGQSEFFVENSDSLLFNQILHQLPLEFSKDSPTLHFEKVKAASLGGKDLKLEYKDNLETFVFTFGDLYAYWEQSFTDKTQTHRVKINAQNSRFDAKDENRPTIAIEEVLANAMRDENSNFVFEGEVTIPKDPFEIFPLPEVVLNISKCDLSSSSATSKSKLSFSIDKKDPKNDELRFTVLSEGSVSEVGYKNHLKNFLAGLKELSTLNEPESKITKDLLANNEKELTQLVPNLYSLSPMGLNIDIGASLQKNEENIETAKLDIKDCNLTMLPYSFFLNGKAEFVSFSGQATIKIRVDHYKKMIQDLVGYVNNFMKVTSIFYQTSDFEITTDQVDQTLALLRKISDEPKMDNEDLKLTIKVLNDGSTKIGEVDMSEATDQLDKIFEKPEEKGPESTDGPSIDPNTEPTTTPDTNS